MSMRRYSRVSAPNPLAYILPPVCVTALLWGTRINPVSETTVAYSFLLFLLPWSSFLRWRHEKRGGLPVFAMVGLMYWLYFAVAAFWADRTDTVGRMRLITEESVTAALWLAVVGVICLWAGMRVRLPVPGPSRQADLVDRPGNWVYIRAVLVLGTLASVASGVTDLLGAGGRQIIQILVLVVPTVALLLLLRRYLDGKASTVDRVLLAVYFPARVLAGLSSGWLGSVVGLGLVCAAMYIFVRKKIPWSVCTVSVLAVLFLQVGKSSFRDRYWAGRKNGSVIEKATFWISQSEEKWSEALSGRSQETPMSLASESLQRTSLLSQVVNVLEVTPKRVPFQEGATYSYMAVTFIPRFIWPDKPSVNDANRYYQVAFGITDARNLDSVSISVGCLAEAYINFGWFGVVGVMFVIGMVLGVYERSFVAQGSSGLYLACGLALLPGFLSVEAQMAQYLGGVVQYVVLTLVVFYPVTRRTDLVRRAGGRQMPVLRPGTAGLNMGSNS